MRDACIAVKELHSYALNGSQQSKIECEKTHASRLPKLLPAVPIAASLDAPKAVLLHAQFQGTAPGFGKLVFDGQEHAARVTFCTLALISRQKKCTFQKVCYILRQSTIFAKNCATPAPKRVQVCEGKIKIFYCR